VIARLFAVAIRSIDAFEKASFASDCALSDDSFLLFYRRLVMQNRA
jgi:hypothetical protein